MRKPKYNYTSLYEEFVLTKDETLAPFLRGKGILGENESMSNLSSSVQTRFKGWAQKKRANLSMSNVQAKAEITQSALERWKTVYRNVEKGEMKQLNEMVEIAVHGMPVYAMKTKESKKVIDLSKGEKGKIGYRPLTFQERNSLFSTLRLAQGKASEITLNMIMSATGEIDSDPCKDKLKELRAKGKVKKIKRLELIEEKD